MTCRRRKQLPIKSLENVHQETKYIALSGVKLSFPQNLKIHIEKKKGLHSENLNLEIHGYV